MNLKENEEETKLESDYKIALDLLTNTHENNSKQTNEEYKKKQEEQRKIMGFIYHTERVFGMEQGALMEVMMPIFEK